MRITDSPRSSKAALIVICALATTLAFSPALLAREHDILQAKRLSERILTISSYTSNSKVVAVNSEKGIVLVNTLWSPSIAGEAAEIIKEQFGRDDFAYLINTTGGDCMSRGNAAFPGVPIIAHEDSYRHLAGLTDEVLRRNLDRRADEFHERVVRSNRQMNEVEAGSDRAALLQAWIDYCARIEVDMRRGYELVLPTIIFKDRMTLDLGDLNIELVYFGVTDNHGDTVIKIPEENFVYLSDVFHAGHMLPRPRLIDPEITLFRWLSTLDGIIEDGDENSIVTRANGVEEWDIARVANQRIFISQIWEKLKRADADGKNLTEALETLSPVDEVFPYIKNWRVYASYGAEIIEGDVRGLAGAIWRADHIPAAEEIAKVLEREGLAAATAKFEELRNAGGNDVFFHERDFNVSGYDFIRKEKYPEAIAMFKFGIECWPEAWNLLDSLGEAYMLNGDTDLAIASYRKSVELFPDNENGRTMLKRLEAK